MVQPSNNIVTVVIPTFNRRDLIIEAIQSVKAQTYRPIELIVVDDGSTDDTRTVVDNWLQEEGENNGFQLRYLYQENRGLSAARNVGLHHSSGKYLQFLDSDDWLHPDKLQKQVEVFEAKENIDSVVAQVSYVNEKGKVTVNTNIMKDETDPDLVTFLAYHDLPAHAPLHRTSRLKEINGFNETFPFGEEGEMHMRMAFAGAHMIFISDILAFVRFGRRPDRLTAQPKRRPDDYDARYYQQIVNEGARYGRSDKRFKQAIAERLLDSGCRYLSKGQLNRGKCCFETVKKIFPELKPFKIAVYLIPVGRSVGVLWEVSLRAIRLLRFRARRVVKY